MRFDPLDFQAGMGQAVEVINKTGIADSGARRK